MTAGCEPPRREGKRAYQILGLQTGEKGKKREVSKREKKGGGRKYQWGGDGPLPPV